MDLLLILTVIMVCFVVLALYINTKLSSMSAQRPGDEVMKIISLLEQGGREDRKVMLDSLQKNTQALNERLDTAARVIGEVQKNVGEMGEIGRSMRELQEFLQSPKIRGNIGEQVLRDLLAQMLPKGTFHLQYAFRSGEKVDAAITTAAGIVPVDSKFPMENFKKMVSDGEGKQKAARDFERDVKKHISEISRKYILTEEGTIDYALMYVPSEAVYYEIVNNHALFEYAGSCRVLPVSPTTFYAYMKAILMSFEGQKIESRAKEILSILKAVQNDYAKVEENMNVLQKHINNASNMMNTVVGEFSKLGGKIKSTSVLGVEGNKKLS